MPKTKKKKVVTRFRGAHLPPDVETWVQAKLDASIGTKYQPWQVALYRLLMDLEAKGKFKL